MQEQQQQWQKTSLVPDHPLGEELFPNIKPKVALTQL